MMMIDHMLHILTFLLAFAPLSDAGYFQEPSFSLCEGSICSSGCNKVSTGSSCVEGPISNVYAAASCSESGSFSLKVCIDSGCNNGCVSVSSGGCDTFNFLLTQLSVNASCELTSLAIGVIVVSVLLLLLCCCSLPQSLSLQLHRPDRRGPRAPLDCCCFERVRQRVYSARFTQRGGAYGPSRRIKSQAARYQTPR